MLKASALSIMTLFATSPLYANTLLDIQTSKGNIEVELFDDQAPTTVKNFKQYVESDFYQNTIFHRVINGFMIQGGGFDEQMNQKVTLGKIKNEADNGIKNTRGTLAMARTQDPNSAESQFFINLSDNDFLDKQVGNPGYAVFGKVINGMEVVDQIAKVQTTSRNGHRDVPSDNIVIKKIQIKTDSKK